MPGHENARATLVDMQIFRLSAVRVIGGGQLGGARLSAVVV
jgi:hypothetical protein